MPSITAPTDYWIKLSEQHERKGNLKSEIACLKRARAQAKRDRAFDLAAALSDLIETRTRILVQKG